MGRRYASSVHSQKSTTSAKSGRSFLSLTWPSINAYKTNPEPILVVKEDDISIKSSESTPKLGIWKNIKSWLPAGQDQGKNTNSSFITPFKKLSIGNDSDSIATKSTSASSSISSKSRLKQLFTFTSGNKRNSSTIAASSNSRGFFSAQSPDSNNDRSENTGKNKNASPTYSSPSLPLVATQQKRTGILINHGKDTEEAIAERLKRKHQRREHILKLQNQRRSIHYHPTHSFQSAPSPRRNSHDHLTAATTAGTATEEPALESSSSDTLLTDEFDNYWNQQRHKSYEARKPAVAFQQNEEEDKNEQAVGDGWGFYNPRIMFVEPSPVPRFRNVAPPPPPSPLYLSITVPASDNKEITARSGDKQLVSQIQWPSVADDDDDDDRPTIFTTMKLDDMATLTTATTATVPTSCNSTESRKEQCIEDEGVEEGLMDEHDRNISLLIRFLQPKPIEKPVLRFHRPYHRGQTITFSLTNIFPEDHIILFKFMTSTTQSAPAPNSWQNRYSYIDGANTLGNAKKGRQQASVERYFVRPSAGKIVSSSATDQMNIMLFLNQVPAELIDTGSNGRTDELRRATATATAATKVKDKIIIKWAAIQKNTRIEEWANSLHESTRRRWLDMLDGEWPGQVTIRMTRIKIRFEP